MTRLSQEEEKYPGGTLQIRCQELQRTKSPTLVEGKSSKIKRRQQRRMRKCQHCYWDDGTGLFAYCNCCELELASMFPHEMMLGIIAMSNLSCARKMASTTKVYKQQQQN
jgi:hypothetical protein